MNITKIKEIVNSEYPEEYQEQMILKEMSQDKNVIPTLLKILQIERVDNERLIIESNSELSRALVAFVEGEKVVEKSFVIGEIKKFYLKWQHKVRCNFKFNDLP